MDQWNYRIWITLQWNSQKHVAGPGLWDTFTFEHWTIGAYVMYCWLFYRKKLSKQTDSVDWPIWNREALCNMPRGTLKPVADQLTFTMQRRCRHYFQAGSVPGKRRGYVQTIVMSKYIPILYQVGFVKPADLSYSKNLNKDGIGRGKQKKKGCFRV